MPPSTPQPNATIRDRLEFWRGQSWNQLRDMMLEFADDASHPTQHPEQVVVVLVQREPE